MKEHPVIAAILNEFEGAKVTNIIAFDEAKKNSGTDEALPDLPDDQITEQTDEF